MRRLHIILIITGLLGLSGLMTSTVLAAKQAHTDEHGNEDKSASETQGIEKETHEEEGHDEHAEDGERRTTIAADMAELTELQTRQAGPGTLARTLTSYGRLDIDPERIAQVTGRFAGQVKRVTVGLGDTVEAGDTLAIIESNDSLQPYTLHAPIAGTVTHRNLNLGERVDGQTLFAIANLDTLWAELKIFPAQRQQVRVGQTAEFSIDGKAYSGDIMHLLPSPGNAPYTIARVAIDNREGLLVPGQLVTAEVVIETAEVPLAVDNRGLQQFEDEPVVFVQEGQTYEARHLELGRSDDHVTEVLSGLASGERYVVENSYLIKADLEKSGASHSH